MKVKDLDPDTYYATCDGLMVKPIAPVNAKWHAVYAGDDNGQMVRARANQESSNGYRVEFVNDAEVTGPDPWGGCGNVAERRTHAYRVGGIVRSHDATGARGGVLVEYWSADRDGNPLEKQGRRVLHARDIPGTWTEYLVLHGERLREMWNRRDEKALLQEQAQMLTERLREAGVLGHVLVLENYARNDPKRDTRDGAHFYLAFEITGEGLNTIERIVAQLEAGYKALARRKVRKS